MNDAALQAELERAEEAYENLMRTRATLGSALAEAIRRGRDLSEFGQHVRDLPHLIRRADVRRTELRVELLARRVKEAQEGHRQAARDATRSGTAVEEAMRAYARVASVEQQLRLEVRRFEEQHHGEMERLARLRAEVAGSEEKEVAAS